MLADFRAACAVQKASVQPDEINRYVLYDRLHGARNSSAPVLDDEDW